MGHNKVNRKGAVVASLILLGGSILLFFVILFAMTKGAVDISLETVWEAIFHFDSSNREHLIIVDLRLTREIASMLVGAAFAVAGAMMQGVTRNPLADSGLMGLNAGAGFALALGFAFCKDLSYINVMGISFLGAALGALLVYGISAIPKGGVTPIRLVLAGAAISALLTALSQAIGIHFKVGQKIMFWTMGSVAGVNWIELRILAPIIVASLIISIILSRAISLLSLGEEVAKGLGVNVLMIKFVVMVIVVMLAGSSVAVVGAVGFVGMIVPHFTRYLVGSDYRLIIPCSAILGGILIVVADLIARTINPPFETPLGVITALIGVPIFLYLAKRQKGAL
jgi:iron complex transport system permease protein